MKTPPTEPKLSELPADQHAQLAAWLLDEGLSCRQAQEQLHAKYGVETTLTAVYGFYLEDCLPRRLRRAATAANALPGRAGTVMANWDESNMAIVKQRYFELLAAPAADPKELALFATQVVYAERARNQRDTLLLQQEKTRADLRLKRKTFALKKWLYQTRLADQALRYVRDIKTIAADRTMDDKDKIEQVRRRLFGRRPRKAESGMTNDE